ncbi:MAG: hypothetical protein H0T79_03675, partial [Deltaproteobacteria bacterium]|nr:hypothetical protein [Deltaproteobacteria bacterium]
LHEPRPTPPLRLDLGKGAHIDVPATAWPMKGLIQSTDDTVRGKWGFVIPTERVGLTIGDLDRGEYCTTLSATPDAGVADWLKKLFAGATFEVRTATRVKLGDAAAYVEVEQEGRKMAVFLVCHDASFVQLSVFGTRPHSELRAVLEPIAKSFVGAPANQAP